MLGGDGSASRVIDQITDSVGDQKAFAAAAGVVLVALVGGLVVGKLAAVASMATLVTLCDGVRGAAHRESRVARAERQAGRADPGDERPAGY